MNYQPKTDQEIRQLALDVCAGRVFGTWSHPEAANLSFSILSLLDASHLKAMQDEKIAHIYEYLDKAGPRSINGLPSFFSFRSLNAEDAGRLQAEIDRAKSMQAAFMSGADNA